MNQKPTQLINLLPILGLGGLLMVCVCAVVAYLGLNALGVITTQVNLFGTATPTFVSIAATATPTPGSAISTVEPTPDVTEPPLATFEPPDKTATPTFVSIAPTAIPTSDSVISTVSPTTGATEPPLATFESPDKTAAPTETFAPETNTPAATTAETTPIATSDIPKTYVAFDADFFADECPLFAGDNETRKYECDLGEYYMLHKQATTRYTFYDTVFTDAVIEANGWLTKGTGKYEYGVVFRANDEGTLYYVFTVTNDGKYNVALYKDEKYTDLIPYTASSFVNTGEFADNLFKITMRGGNFDFYLNNHYLDSVTDTAIASGVTGLFFYNGEPDAEVGFDQLTISTFTPPPPTATPGAETVVPPTPTGEGAETIAPTATTQAGPATVAPKPGVYVNGLRYTPRSLKRGDPVTFFATFVNLTGKAQNLKWFVEIWEADPNKKNPYGQADGLQREIPAGTNERATGDSWKVAGGGPCLPFRARVVFQDDQSRRIPFKQTSGGDLWVSFQVCP